MRRAWRPPCRFPVYHRGMPRYGIVYLVRNKTNGKVYIGRTTQPLALRWAGHVHDSKGNVATGLHGAIKRQGPDAFAVKELEEHSDRASLMLGERAAIDRYHARDPNVGYNIMAGYREGGDGYTGPGRQGQELRNKVLKIRVTEAQLEAMIIRASADGRTVSDWARIQLERVLELPLPGTTLMVATGSEPVRTDSVMEAVDQVPVATPVATPSMGDDTTWLESLEFDLGD